MNTTKRQLEILLEFGKVINRTRTLNSVLEAMADFARDILHADRCSIFIYDKNTDELWSKFAHNIEPIRISAKKGVAGYAALSQDTQIVVDAYDDYRFNPEVDKATGYLTQSILAVPLLDNQGHTIGVFQALNKKDFLKQMQKAKNTGMNGHIVKSRDINKLSEILRKIFI